MTETLVHAVDDDGAMAVASVERHCASLFVSALIWTLGATLDEAGRGGFDDALRAACARAALSVEFPAGSAFAFVFDPMMHEGAGAWVQWEVPSSKTIRRARTIAMPTADNVSMLHWAKLYARAGVHALFVGASSCGKTTVLGNALAGNSGSVSLHVMMSTGLTAPMLQSSIFARLEKRRRLVRGCVCACENACAAAPPRYCVPPQVYGAPAGTKMHIFVDDVHAADAAAPQQSALETLRQLCGNGGWYEGMEVRAASVRVRSLTPATACVGQYNAILDVTVVAAAHESARAPMPRRLLRYFNLFRCQPPTTETLASVFSALYLRASGNAAFDAHVAGVCAARARRRRGVRGVVTPASVSHPARSTRDRDNQAGAAR